jgi:glucosamine-phosphate N-acetyltransferase
MKFVNLYDYVLKYSDNISEIKQQYLLLLGELTTVSDITHEYFFETISKINSMGEIIVAIDEESQTIICSGTIIIEPKIIHGGRPAGHIEDIVVLEKWRNKGIAKNLLEYLREIAIEKNCYKIILDCNEQLVPFYEKSGFSKKGIQMFEYI